MKTIKKYWWIILVMTAVIYIVVLKVKVNHLHDDKQIQAVELSTLKQEVLVHKSKAGDLTFKLNSVNIEKDNLKKSLDVAGFDIKELKGDNIKWRKLNNVLKIELEAAGHGETEVIDTFRIESTDTVYYSKVGDWSNDYLSLFNAKVETKKLFFDYKYKTGINIFQEPTKKGTIVTVKLSDPLASITSANSITVVHKKKWHEKWWFWTAIGVTGGIMITK